MVKTLANRTQDSLFWLLTKISKPESVLVLGNDELAEFLTGYFDVPVHTKDEADWYDFVYLADASFFDSIQNKTNTVGVSEVYGYDRTERRDMFPLTHPSRKLFYDVWTNDKTDWSIDSWRQGGDTRSEGLMTRKVALPKKIKDLGFALLSDFGDLEDEE